MSEKNIAKIQKEFFVLMEQIEDVYERTFARWNLSKNAFSTLYHLRENAAGLEPSRLAEMVGVQRQMMTIILNDLQERGFILRKEQKTDRRRKRILLSKPGRRFADEALRIVGKIDGRALSAFTEEERTLFLEFYRRYYNAIKDLDVVTTVSPP